MPGVACSFGAQVDRNATQHERAQMPHFDDYTGNYEFVRGNAAIQRSGKLD